MDQTCEPMNQKAHKGWATASSYTLAFCAVSSILLTISCERSEDTASASGVTLDLAALDRSDASLAKPDNLPRIDPNPVVWSVARRAAMLHADGVVGLKANKLKAALSGLAGAVQLDPALVRAHLDLARVYARAGRGSVAVGILGQMAKDLTACGGCIEALRAAQNDPDLRPLLATASGQKIIATLGKKRLPWQEWGLQVSHSLADGTGRLLPGFVHSRVPFVLTRSCPTCSNPERREPQSRELFGARVAVKLASRFNTREKRFGGVPLNIAGSGKRQGQCIVWPVKLPVDVGTASLQQLCFRPLSQDRAALTAVDIIYGRSKADVARSKQP